MLLRQGASGVGVDLVVTLDGGGPASNPILSTTSVNPAINGTTNSARRLISTPYQRSDLFGCLVRENREALGIVGPTLTSYQFAHSHVGFAQLGLRTDC